MAAVSCVGILRFKPIRGSIDGGSVKPETTLTNACRCDGLRLMWQRKCRNYRNGLEVECRAVGPRVGSRATENNYRSTSPSPCNGLTCPRRWLSRSMAGVAVRFTTKTVA